MGEKPRDHIRASHDGKLWVSTELYKMRNVDAALFELVVYPAFQKLYHDNGGSLIGAIKVFMDYEFHPENIERCLRKHYAQTFYKEACGRQNRPQYND